MCRWEPGKVTWGSGQQVVLGEGYVGFYKSVASLNQHKVCCALVNREEWYFSGNNKECCLLVDGVEWYFSGGVLDG